VQAAPLELFGNVDEFMHKWWNYNRNSDFYIIKNFSLEIYLNSKRIIEKWILNRQRI